jgi:hypothetical protein
VKKPIAKISKGRYLFIDAIDAVGAGYLILDAVDAGYLTPPAR